MVSGAARRRRGSSGLDICDAYICTYNNFFAPNIGPAELTPGNG